MRFILLVKERFRQLIGADDLLVQILQSGHDNCIVGDLLTLGAECSTQSLLEHILTLTLFRCTFAKHLRLVLLWLLALAVRGTVQELGKNNDLLEGHHIVHHICDLLLVLSKIYINETKNAPLEVDVEAIDHGDLCQVHLIELEQVEVIDLLVAKEEVTASTGVLDLHQLLDANVLDHVGDTLQLLDNVPFSLCLIEQSAGKFVWSPQGMADFMGDQHGLHRFGNIPNRHDKMPRLNIE